MSNDNRNKRTADDLTFQVRPDDRAIRYVTGPGMRTHVQPGDVVVLRLDDDSVDVRAVHVQVTSIDGNHMTGSIVRAAALPHLATNRVAVQFNACEIFRCTAEDEAPQQITAA